ncbi:hypothetical protein ACH5AI_06045 [Streptomyces collinus]|uniref:hypothetical protein n=1 Tax=Streptomyces collinus TaxID=42684 RepID=UPI0037BAB638
MAVDRAYGPGDRQEAAGPRVVAVAVAGTPADSADHGVLVATADDIVHGRRHHAYLAPHAACLMGERRYHADLPPLNA